MKCKNYEGNTNYENELCRPLHVRIWEKLQREDHWVTEWRGGVMGGVLSESWGLWESCCHWLSRENCSLVVIRRFKWLMVKFQMWNGCQPRQCEVAGKTKVWIDWPSSLANSTHCVLHIPPQCNENLKWLKWIYCHDKIYIFKAQ